MTEGITNRKGVKRGYVVAAIICALIIACGVSGDGSGSSPSSTRPAATSRPATRSCLAQSQAFAEETLDLLEEWQDTSELASSTARIALSPVIGQLQRIRRDVAGLSAPACARPVKDLLLEYMDADIDAYLKFMAQQSDGIVERQFNMALDILEDFQTEWTKLLHGEPPYD